MSRFTTENTQGYSPVQLDMLNSIFHHELKMAGHPTEKSTVDRIAQCVLRDFDRGEDLLLETLTRMETPEEYLARKRGRWHL